MASKKYRYWQAIVYPESAPEDWIDILDSLHIPAVISPLHDDDVKEETGEIKKPHYHVTLLFDGPTTFERVAEIMTKIKAARWEQVVSLRGNMRYMCHLDNPEKAQYNEDDMVFLSGAQQDYEKAIELPDSRYAVIKEIRQYVIDNDIVYYSDLFETVPDKWFKVLCDTPNIYYFMRDRSWRWEQKQKRR